MSISRKLPSILPSLRKGDRLYAAITYRTPNLFISHYLPKAFFVLEVILEQVSEGLGGLQYFFDTNFQLDHCYVSKDLENVKEQLAEKVKADLLYPVPPENMFVFTSEEYKGLAKAHQVRLRA